VCEITDRLWPRDSDGLRKRLGVLLGIALVVWGLTDVRNRGRIDPHDPLVHKTDFTCYTEAAKAFLADGDPYSTTNVRGWGYPYPPLFALLVAPLAPLDSRLQVVIFYAISLAFCWGCYGESRRLWQWALTQGHANHDAERSKFLRWLPWIVLAIVALPVLNCLQRGQVGIVKAYFILLGIRWLCTKADWRWALAAGVVLALPVAIKVTPILPLAVIIASMTVTAIGTRERRQAWLRAGAVSGGAALGMLLFFVLVPAAILGWEANVRHLQRWLGDIAVKANDHSGADRTGNTRTVRNQSLGNAVFRSGNFVAFQLGLGPDDRAADDGNLPHGVLPMDSPTVERILLMIRLGLLGLLGLALLMTAWRRDTLAIACVWGMASAATLLVVPIGRAHYFMLLLPAVFLVPLWLWQRRCRRSAWVAAIAPAALVTLHYVALGLAGRVGLLGLGTTVWYVWVMARLIRPGVPAAIAAATPTIVTTNGGPNTVWASDAGAIVSL